MIESYDRRQRPANWPTRDRWNSERLPGWYLELLGGLAADLTAWRHDPPQRLDPRCDPRRQCGRFQRRAIR
jgi:hypothetical protein